MSSKAKNSSRYETAVCSAAQSSRSTSMTASARRPRVAKSIPVACGLSFHDAETNGEQLEPSAGQQVDRRQLLGQYHGMAVRQQQDSGAEKDPIGEAATKVRHCQRIGHRECRRHLEATEGHSRVEHEMLRE